MASQFSNLFKQYYAIHETISAVLAEDRALDEDEIAQRVKERHPDLDMGPATLSAAIRSALRNTPEALRASREKPAAGDPAEAS
jgi:hypothetical protein